MSSTEVFHLASTDVSNALQLHSRSQRLNSHLTVNIVRGDCIVQREVRDFQLQRANFTTGDGLVTLIPVTIFQNMSVTHLLTNFNSLLTGIFRGEDTQIIQQVVSFWYFRQNVS